LSGSIVDAKELAELLGILLLLLWGYLGVRSGRCVDGVVEIGVLGLLLELGWRRGADGLDRVDGNSAVSLGGEERIPGCWRGGGDAAPWLYGLPYIEGRVDVG